MNTDRLTSSFMSLRERLHRSAIGFLNDDEDARDAVQDTFANLWSAGEIRTDAEARNKLFAVLRNVCIDRLRRPKVSALRDEEAARLWVPPDDAEDMQRLEALLTDGLTEMQIRVYTLVAHDGLEYDEIATRLGTTVEAVRMHMSRARKKIRDNYKRLDR